MLMGLAVNAHAGLFEDCQTTSASLNKQYPQQVDKLTTVFSTMCAPDKVRPKLIYIMTLDTAKAEIPDVKTGLAKLKKTKSTHGAPIRSRGY